MRSIRYAVILSVAASTLAGCANSTVGNQIGQDVGRFDVRNGPPNAFGSVSPDGTRRMESVGPVSETEMEIPWDLEAVQTQDGGPVNVGATYATIKNRNGGVVSRELITKFLGAPALLRSGDDFKIGAAKITYDPETKKQIIEGLTIESVTSAPTRAMQELSAAFSAYAAARDERSADVLKRRMEMWEKIAPEAVDLVRGALAAFGLPDPSAVVK